MRLLPAAVLEDPRYRMPATTPADAGVGWLRAAVPRFCDGDDHARRRALVEEVLAGLVVVPCLDPATVLLQALGLPADCRADVALVATAYQPHAPQTAAADAAADRLVERCGGRTEAAAARVCVLVQAHAAMAALLAGGEGPPVPRTRRVAPDGSTVEVDLTGAPFGAGPHACPGRPIAEALAGARVAGVRS
jgi:hypothetical protein